MKQKLKGIKFNEEMEKDFEYIKRQFKQTFNVKPSNTSLMNLLLQTYKNTKVCIKKKPKSKNKFLVEI